MFAGRVRLSICQRLTISTTSDISSNNLRFYVAMLLASRITGPSFPSLKNVADIDLEQATDALILDCISAVWTHYSDLGATDQVAKGTQLGGIVLDSHMAAITAKSMR